MRYVSTRGQAPPQSFDDVLLAGLASDGGLFLPEAWPQLSAAEISAFAGKPYTEVATAILSRFTGDAFAPADLRADIEAAYATFETPEIAPLVDIGNSWNMGLPPSDDEIAALAPLVDLIHLKDRDFAARRTVPLGDGDLPLPESLQDADPV